MVGENFISPAYIFSRDSLVATTDKNGSFQLLSLEPGNYFFTCSAINFRDTTMQVNVIGSQTTNLVFELMPDSSTGRVYGEFQDGTFFQEMLQKNPELTSWSEKELFEGVTGATLQSKTLKRELPYRNVFLGDSLLAVSDDFGQFWFEVQSGTYPIKGTCEGYHEKIEIFQVLPNERTYITFVLKRKVSE
jgi:hypothetical protein